MDDIEKSDSLTDWLNQRHSEHALLFLELLSQLKILTSHEPCSPLPSSCRPGLPSPPVRWGRSPACSPPRTRRRRPCCPALSCPAGSWRLWTGPWLSRRSPAPVGTTISLTTRQPTRFRGLYGCLWILKLSGQYNNNDSNILLDISSSEMSSLGDVLWQINWIISGFSDFAQFAELTFCPVVKQQNTKLDLRKVVSQFTSKNISCLFVWGNIPPACPCCTSWPGLCRGRSPRPAPPPRLSPLPTDPGSENYQKWKFLS